MAGHHTKACEYLLGNHVIAESMFRHHPKTLLNAPLRVLVHADADAAFATAQQNGTLTSET